MKISTKGKWIAAVVSVAGGFVLLSGFGGGPFGGKHRGFSPDKMEKFVTYRVNDALDDLEATPEQRTKILAIKDTMLSEFEKNMPQRKETRAALLAEWKQEKPSQKAVYDAIDRQIDTMRAAAHKAADHLMEVHGLLTPNQRADLAGKFEHNHFMDHE